MSESTSREIADAKMIEHTSDLRGELDDCIAVMLDALHEIDQGSELSRGRSGALECHIKACDKAIGNYRLTQMLGKSDLLDELQRAQERRFAR